MALAPYYDHAGITIYHGDCLDVLPELGPVDLVFTSPPYLNQRSYGLTDFDWYAAVPPALAGVSLTDAGQMLVNLGLKHDQGRVVRYWDALIDACEAQGLRLFGWYAWDKGEGLPGEWLGRFRPSMEFIFHFNRLAAQPSKWVKVKDWRTSTRGLTQADGSRRENRSWVATGKKPDDVLRIPRDCVGGTGHPAPFPIELPGAVIKSWPGLVLDPYMGSGTTLRAAKDLGRKAIGIEIEERYCEIAAKRLSQEVLPLGVANG